MKRQTKNPGVHYIYLYRYGFFFHKIGYTSDPKSRIQRISSFSPLPPQDIQMFRMPNDGTKWRAYEKEIHKLHEDCRVKGEWFHLPKSRIKLVYNDLEEKGGVREDWNENIAVPSSMLSFFAGLAMRLQRSPSRNT